MKGYLYWNRELCCIQVSAKRHISQALLQDVMMMQSLNWLKLTTEIKSNYRSKYEWIYCQAPQQKTFLRILELTYIQAQYIIGIVS